MISTENNETGVEFPFTFDAIFQNESRLAKILEFFPDLELTTTQLVKETMMAFQDLSMLQEENLMALNEGSLESEESFKKPKGSETTTKKKPRTVGLITSPPNIVLEPESVENSPENMADLILKEIMPGIPSYKRDKMGQLGGIQTKENSILMRVSHQENEKNLIELQVAFDLDGHVTEIRNINERGEALSENQCALLMGQMAQDSFSSDSIKMILNKFMKTQKKKRKMKWG